MLHSSDLRTWSRLQHLLPVDSQFLLEGIPVSLGGLLWDKWKFGVRYKGKYLKMTKLRLQLSLVPC